MPSRTTALIAALAAVIATAGAAHAEDPARPRRLPKQRSARAAALRQRGLEHFLSREYQQAANDLMEAYRLDKRAETLFGWAEAVRATGDCELAPRIYHRLLDKTKDAKLTEKAEAGIAACEGSPGAAVVPDALASAARLPTPTDIVISAADAASSGTGAAASAAEIDDNVQLTDDPEPTPAKPAVPLVPDATPHTTSYLLLGGGGVIALGGLITYATASDGSGLVNATHADVTSARSNGDWHRLIGASVAVVGTGVALVGLLFYRSERRPVDHALALAPYFPSSGAGVAVTGRF